MKQIFTLGLAACLAWTILPAEAAVVAGAPAPPKDVVAKFPEGSLYGYINFTAPQLTVGGDQLGGNLHYEISVNNQVQNEGEVYPGVDKSVDLTMPKAGVYTFSVVLSNDAGKSEAVSVVAGAGYSPAMPPSPAAVINDEGNVRIFWSAVTKAEDGSNIANKNVTYTVERYPDGYMVAVDTPELFAIDSNLDGNLHAYRYYVWANYNATPGYENITAPVVVGIAPLPFTTSFETQDEFDLFNVIDGNQDGRTWEFYYGDADINADTAKKSDDWMISPAFQLQNGGFHPISIDAKVFDSDYPGIFEVVYGPAPSTDAMTYVAIPETEVKLSSYQTYNGSVNPTWDGPTYFGIHCISEPNMWHFRVTNFKVQNSVAGLVPDAPADFKGTPDIDGKLLVEFTLTAPEKDLDGNQLDKITRLEILRDGELIHTFEDVTPGKTLSFTDTEEEKGLTQGDHTYTAIAYNEYGPGFVANLNLFAGINLPGLVPSIRAYERENGIVTIEWEPVTTYIDGTPLNPDNVTYTVWTTVNGENLQQSPELKETSYTYRIMIEDDPQLFWHFGVYTTTSYGSNYDSLMTDYLPIGEPNKAPYEDSFTDLKCNYSYVMGGSDSKTFWDNASDKFFDIQSQDADNGMLYAYGEEIGSQAYLLTEKTDLKGVANPMLTFYVNNMEGEIPDTNTIEVQVMANGEQEFTSLGTWTLCELGGDGWHRIAVPLDAYKDRQVRFRLLGTIKAYRYIHLDNMQIRSRRNYDLELTSLSAPERVKAGNQCPIILSYANHGLSDAGEFSIELLQDGKMVAEQTFDGLATDCKGDITLPVLHSVVTPETVTYEVRLNYAPDQDKSNNSFEPFEVMTISPAYPAVTDLAAGYGENPNEICLAWSEPDLSSAFEDDVVANFEDARSWATSVDGWTFVDVDRQLIYGFEPWIVLPDNAPKGGSRQSWWVCDASYEPMIQHYSDPRFYEAHSGKKYIISMAVTDEDFNSVRSDDWAISPELPGIQQTVSLWAKAMLEDAPETFEFLYSTTDKELDSFETLQTVKNVGWDWTQYFFDLPEGTKYFAIRAISRDQYVLMVDDVNFIPAGKGADLKVAGYNVYCDKKPLNEAPVSSRRFDTTRSDAAVQQTYNVTVVYEGRGESVFSNDAVPVYSAVEGVATDAIRVSASAGTLTVTGAEGLAIRVFAADGATMAAEQGSGVNNFRLNAGIYLVQIADRSWKVVIR